MTPPKKFGAAKSKIVEKVTTGGGLRLKGRLPYIEFQQFVA